MIIACVDYLLLIIICLRYVSISYICRCIWFVAKPLAVEDMEYRVGIAAMPLHDSAAYWPR